MCKYLLKKESQSEFFATLKARLNMRNNEYEFKTVQEITRFLLRGNIAERDFCVQEMFHRILSLPTILSSGVFKSQNVGGKEN